MNIQRITVSDKTVEVEIDYFNLMRQQWSATMTEQEINQLVVDACEVDLT